MKDSIFLVLTRRGIDRTAKTTNFTLQPGERAVRVEIEVEDKAFAPSAIPTIRMHVPADQLIQQIEVEGAQIVESE